MRMRKRYVSLGLLMFGLAACATVEESTDTSAYYVAHYTINDADMYGQYTSRVGDTLAPYNAELVVVDMQSAIKEGTPGPATIVLRFPSMEALEGWYNSPAYQEIIHLRTDSIDGQVTFAKGYGQ